MLSGGAALNTNLEKNYRKASENVAGTRVVFSESDYHNFDIVSISKINFSSENSTNDLNLNMT